MTDILIDLSRRCLDDHEFSINNLMEIASRLFSIRDLLGGSMYLIRGFSAVLETNEVRLRDFQKAILDLITDLNTPDVLSAYLTLMTSENPPLDLLLNRLMFLGSSVQYTQPSIEVEFPTFGDIEIKHNCNPTTIDSIRKMCVTHEQNKLDSPLTQAALIAPLQDFTFRPWSKEGFTFTSWVRLNSNISTTNSSGIDTTYEDECFSDPGSQQCICKNNLHFLSIGTSSLVLSVYLCMSNVSTMFFQLSNPIVQAHRGLSKSHSDHFRCNDSSHINGTRKTKCACSNLKKRRSSSKKDLIQSPDGQNEQRNQRRVTRSKERRRANNIEENNISTSPNALSSTMRMALKSSLSHFNIFSSNRSNEKENEATNFGVPTFIKGLKLNKSRWSLFSLSVVFTKTEMKIKVSIDNTSIGTIDLPCSLSQVDTKREKFTIMGLGHRLPPHITLKNNINKDSSGESDINSINFKYSLSNVLLFKTNEMNSEMLANLYALGPDCVNFAQCQVGNLLPNLGIPATNKTHTTMHVNEVLKGLREQILLVYSAHRPNMIIGYHNIDGKFRIFH